MTDQERYGEVVPFTGEEEEVNLPAPVVVESERALAEVQAMMAIAKRFPRNQHSAYQRIMEACKRQRLAEQAQYVYPRGTTTIEGASIRLAEVLAANWGNLKYGLREMAQRPGESDVEAFAWDLETNVYVSRSFVVKHRRMARGSYTDLEDPRDIYEMVANYGQRRVQACILEVIPGDITDAAIDQCNKTLAGGSDEPIEDRVRAIVVAFANYGVTQKMIETRLGHKLEATIEPELVILRQIYQSLKDGVAKREDFFTLGEVSPSPPETQPKAKSERKKPKFIDPERRKELETIAQGLGLDFIDVIHKITGKRIVGKMTPEEADRVEAELEKLEVFDQHAFTEEQGQGTDNPEALMPPHEWTLTATLATDKYISATVLTTRLSGYPELTQAHIDTISAVVDSGEYTVKDIFDNAGERESMGNFLETVILPKM